MTIVGLAQNYVGSNNINLLEPSGQFGTRNSVSRLLMVILIVRVTDGRFEDNRSREEKTLPALVTFSPASRASRGQSSIHMTIRF
jgi:hypothetical protein